MSDQIMRLKKALDEAESVIIGAGAGLSTSAGFVYTGERFREYFSDFASKYSFHDMYSGGFYPYTSMEEFWGFWCRYIWINRYAPMPSDVYEVLLSLVRGKDYFVITTNVDHCFQRAGFNKERLFYTQGDYGLFQSSRPKGITKSKTYDNHEIVRKMVLSEGYGIAADGQLVIPDETKISMTIPTELVPVCPDDGELMTTNLRADDTFVEDEGWHNACRRYENYLKDHEQKKTLFLELGVGANTPGIIKYPFWKRVFEWPDATYGCLNLGQAYAPKEILARSVCIDQDIGDTLRQLAGQRKSE